MRATIYGFNEFNGKKFNYTLENVVCMSVILDRIIIQYIDVGGVPQNAQYIKDNVKIVIEN